MLRIPTLVAALAPALLLPLPARAANDDLTTAWSRFLAVHVRGGRVDYAAAAGDGPALAALSDAFAAATVPAAPAAAKAFWIDAYNFSALHAVSVRYPVGSPKEVPGFFDREKHEVAGERLTLDAIEREKLGAFGDPRVHFALVCAAASCPPLRDRAWSAAGDPDDILERATRSALADPRFVRVDGETLVLSRLFAWYGDEMERSAGDVRGFVRRYRTDVPAEGPVRYLEYDWSLNDTRESGGADRPRRRDLAFDSPAALLVPGELEVKTFHNFYTQTAFFDADGNRVKLAARQTYYTGELDLRRGISRRFTGRVDLIWKAVRDGLFDVTENSRAAFTAVAPRLQVAPFRRAPSVVAEAGVEIPLRDGLDGSGDEPFLDAGDPVIALRLQHDRFHRPRFYGYYEVGGRLRLDGTNDETQLTTPVKAILHWLPSRNWTLTLPLEVAPSWLGDGRGDFYSQVGAGAKFRPQPNLELETIVTIFPLGRNAGAGATVNLGLRWVR
jgi:hypothetical protein